MIESLKNPPKFGRAFRITPLCNSGTGSPNLYSNIFGIGIIIPKSAKINIPTGTRRCLNILKFSPEVLYLFNASFALSCNTENFY